MGNTITFFFFCYILFQKMGQKKAEKIAEKDAPEAILTYLKRQNRPYNANMMVDNFHGAIGKAVMTRTLEKLFENGDLTRKEQGKQKLYFVDRAKMDNPEPEEIVELDDKIVSLKEELKGLEEENKSLSSKNSKISATLSNEELEEQLKKYRELVESSTKERDGLKESVGKIDKEGMAKVDTNLTKLRDEWRRRRKMVKNILGQMEEGTGKRYKDLKKMMELEDDADYKVDYEKMESTAFLEQKKKRKI